LPAKAGGIYRNEKEDCAVTAFMLLSQTGFWETVKRRLYINFVVDDRYMYIVRGLGITLEVTAGAALIGIVIGLFIAVVKVASKQNRALRPLEWAANVYLTVIRGTPVTVQILISYFVIFVAVDIDKTVVAILAFGINSGAYVAEIFRAGIQAVDIGQTEAGRSIGLTYYKTMRFVIFPQAIRNILPALGNEFIALLKETPIAGLIALEDLTKGSDIIKSRTYDAFTPIIVVAVIYLALVLLLTYLQGILERRMRRADRG